MSRIRDDATTVIAAAVRAEQNNLILAALDELDPQDREILLLRGIEQQPNHAVAVMLDISPQAVAMRHRRALERLRARLPGSVFEELGDD